VAARQQRKEKISNETVKARLPAWSMPAPTPKIFVFSAAYGIPGSGAQGAIRIFS
jgi:hypothetical protein